MRLPCLLLLAVTGCATQYVSQSEFMFDFPGPGPACAPRDRACPEVNRHLDAVQATIGDWCGTPREMHLMALRRMGEAAVPTLQRSLDVDGWIRPFFAARTLAGIGHDADVSAWCRAHTEDENFPWVCQGLTPWSLLARAGEL